MKNIIFCVFFLKEEREKKGERPKCLWKLLPAAWFGPVEAVSDVEIGMEKRFNFAGGPQSS